MASKSLDNFTLVRNVAFGIRHPFCGSLEVTFDGKTTNESEQFLLLDSSGSDCWTRQKMKGATVRFSSRR